MLNYQLWPQLEAKKVKFFDSKRLSLTGTDEFQRLFLKFLLKEYIQENSVEKLHQTIFSMEEEIRMLKEKVIRLTSGASPLDILHELDKTIFDLIKNGKMNSQNPLISTCFFYIFMYFANETFAYVFKQYDFWLQVNNFYQQKIRLLTNNLWLLFFRQEFHFLEEYCYSLLPNSPTTELDKFIFSCLRMPSIHGTITVSMLRQIISSIGNDIEARQNFLHFLSTAILVDDLMRINSYILELLHFLDTTPYTSDKIFHFRVAKLIYENTHPTRIHGKLELFPNAKRYAMIDSMGMELAYNSDNSFCISPVFSIDCLETFNVINLTLTAHEIKKFLMDIRSHASYLPFTEQREILIVLEDFYKKDVVQELSGVPMNMKDEIKRVILAGIAFISRVILATQQSNLIEQLTRDTESYISAIPGDVTSMLVCFSA